MPLYVQLAASLSSTGYSGTASLKFKSDIFY